MASLSRDGTRYVKRRWYAGKEKAAARAQNLCHGVAWRNVDRTVASPGGVFGEGRAGGCWPRGSCLFRLIVF